MGHELDALYKEECPHCYEHSIKDFIKSGYLGQVSVLNEVIADFKAGNKDVVHEKLFNLYNDNLQKGIRGVFNPDSDIKKQLDYLYKFDANAAKFAAYKANHVGNKLRELETKDFDKNAKALLKTYNRHQVTEYNTTVARCRTAKQFDNFMQVTTYPNIEWIRSRSANPRELHLKFVGLVLPKTDPFWTINSPGNLYGCKCDWRLSDKPVTTKPDDVLPSKGIEANPTKNRQIFTDDYSYYKDATQHKEVDDYLSKHVLKQFKKEESYYVHPLQDREATDFKDLTTIAKEKAKEGKQVYIMPTMDNQDNDLYKYLFSARKAYLKTSPDLLVNEVFHEFESYKQPFGKNSLKNMLSNGYGQSDIVIIDIRKTPLTKRDILTKLYKNMKQKNAPKITELWILTDEGTEMIYP